MRDGSYCFDIAGPDWDLPEVELHMGGMHNVENTVAAACIAQYIGVEAEKIRAAIKDFKGVHRRFEYIVKLKVPDKFNLVYIDDYAHHPRELTALLQGARSLFNNRWITVVFQPHLYSRTRDLHKEFASALSIANRVILMPIYPARESPIEGISSETIAKDITSETVSIMNADEVLAWLQDEYKNSAP